METSPEHGDSDVRLWTAARHGDQRAFAILYDRHRGRVFRHAYARLQHRVDAEDLTAIAFMELWRRRESVRIVDHSILPWLLVTTTYCCQNHARTRRRHERLLARIPVDPTAPDHAEQLADLDALRHEWEEMHVALSRLSQSDVAIVTLCAVERLPLSSVASVLGIPVGTAKARLSRARRKLRAHVSVSAIHLVEGEEQGSHSDGSEDGRRRAAR
jgi:RNA polymerase sigma factor (sigma-70 family)